MRMILKPLISVLPTPYSDEMLLDLTGHIYRGVTQAWQSCAGAGAAAAACDEPGELGRSRDSRDEPLLLPHTERWVLVLLHHGGASLLLGVSSELKQSLKHESIRLKARIGICLHIPVMRSEQVKHVCVRCYWETEWFRWMHIIPQLCVNNQKWAFGFISSQSCTYLKSLPYNKDSIWCIVNKT